MKKRIAAAALAAVLVCGIIGLRPKAVGLASAGVALGVLAFNLLGVMSGQYDDVAEGIGCFVESGVEGWQKAFVGSENTPSWFVSGWQQIYDTCTGWFDSGEITISADGKVDLTYDQYMQLYHQMIKSVGKPSLEFESAYKCGFFLQIFRNLFLFQIFHIFQNSSILSLVNHLLLFGIMMIALYFLYSAQ